MPATSPDGWSLTLSDIASLSGLEPVAHPVKVADPCTAADPDAALQLPPDELAALRDADMTWVASDGSRYETLLVLPDGTAYGRRGDAPAATPPNDVNGYGGFEGTSDKLFSEEAFLHGIDLLEQVEAGIDPVVDPSKSSGPQLGILCGSLSCDRRIRVDSTATLTGYPFRTIGAWNETPYVGDTYCTGVKIGPRAVLTASHCVLDQNGNFYMLSGYFHPGQTNNSEPNTGGSAVYWSGLNARDWRGGSQYDYAILYLTDRLDSYNLGWFGVAYWTNAWSYTGLAAYIYGYPKKVPSYDYEKCEASTLTTTYCDGWMYGHGNYLDSNAFQLDGTLTFDIDVSAGQSGSSIWTYSSTLGYASLGTATDYDGWGGNGPNWGARFRDAMWNDVCAWIAAVPSQWGQHALCH